MEGPLWKKAYDAAERQASPALTKLFSKPGVIEAMTLGMAVQRRAAADFAEYARRGLHGVNLPSGTDVQKVSNQIAGLERQIRVLNRRIDELRTEADASGSVSDTERTAR